VQNHEVLPCDPNLAQCAYTQIEGALLQRCHSPFIGGRNIVAASKENIPQPPIEQFAFKFRAETAIIILLGMGIG